MKKREIIKKLIIKYQVFIFWKIKLLTIKMWVIKFKSHLKYEFKELKQKKCRGLTKIIIK